MSNDLVPLKLTTDLVSIEGRVVSRGSIVHGKAAVRPWARTNSDYSITVVDEPVWIVRIDGQMTMLREWCAVQCF